MQKVVLSAIVLSTLLRTTNPMPSNVGGPSLPRRLVKAQSCLHITELSLVDDNDQKKLTRCTRSLHQRTNQFSKGGCVLENVCYDYL